MKRKIGKALVVGAGISGIRAALDLADTGYGVTLIDRSPHLGGILSQLDYQFPTNQCGMCKMLPLVNRDSSSQYCLRKGLLHENIEIFLGTELISVEGDPGSFQVTVKQKPNWVDSELCVGCGKCADACPVEVTDIFNVGFSYRKAIYLPVPHALPNPYLIDFSACNGCGKCEEVCPTGAIKLSEQERARFRILVVDDELIVRDSLKELLEDEGFTVDGAESGHEALIKLEKSEYQLMLTDIKMPGMDGVEVLKKAKDNFPDLTVVMMTAYATVETAVEAMKIGALDYLVKPFDPAKLIPMTLGIYEDLEIAQGHQIEVGALVLCGGTESYDPASGKNPFGYKVYPNVVTSLEFERILSCSGPSQGMLVSPFNGKPIRKVAWIQCVGSRDLQSNADFCSNICCMYAIKEALVAKDKSKGTLETTIFYMDRRTFGKSYQRYLDLAEKDNGVRFERGRVHSVLQEEKTGELIILYLDKNGTVSELRQDMVVLSVGQRPSLGTADLAEMMGIRLNQWGFIHTEPFSMNRTSREGILLGGSFAGQRDISDSVILASSAALSASRVIHASGGGLAPETESKTEPVDVSREPPRILVGICTCNGTLSDILNTGEIITCLKRDPQVTAVEFSDRTCTAEGGRSILELMKETKANRLLIGACLPHVYSRKLHNLSEQVGLSPSLVDVVDIQTPTFSCTDQERKETIDLIISMLKMGVARLKRVDICPITTVRISQKALVVGAGIAGMTAAMAIADHGFQVDLIEETDQLGGNLLWLRRTLEGHSTRKLLDETSQKIDKHPLVTIHKNTRIVSSYGRVGRFLTTIKDNEGVPRSLEHGVAIIATGGKEAVTTSYGHGTKDAIVTQMELEIKLNEEAIDPRELKSVVMIQCVDCREEPRNYCSRICCNSALKHALYLKQQNPETMFYFLYRDMMTYGFFETYYTQARTAGMLFIQYRLENKPTLLSDDGSIRITVFEPIIGRDITIEADLVVLSTGLVPNLPDNLEATFGAASDRDGFFKEAESKWRPLDSLKEGIFACGLAHSPRAIEETLATAEAAAQRALRILSQKDLPAGRIVARVRHSLCSLCERCIDFCPYGARFLDEELGRVIVNPVMCQGCGSCATICPNSASIVEGFQKQQMMEIIDAAFV
ncbi:MAG: FAD-dependent oxidoreductase [Thermodesulfobacteriota bacterium]|nr:FAD-dependent oxidoreductase [Thermodesulfobacteriota bacterium]